MYKLIPASPANSALHSSCISSSSTAAHCCAAQLNLHFISLTQVLWAGHDQRCNFPATAADLLLEMSLFLYSLVKHRASNLSEQEGGKCTGAEASLLGTTCVFSSSLCCCCLVYPSTSSPWASCSQRSQHLVPLQNYSSDGVVDFSSASPASRQHCTVNTSLRETTAGESPVSVDGIGHNTHPVL